MLSALALRDAATAAHSTRVEGLAVALGSACALHAAELRALALGARLHDVGKIGVPDAVLNKPGKLDPAEWACMQQHPVLGAELVLQSDISDREVVARLVRHHHEAFDGSGYPDGLAGDAIPVGARMILLADAYDALGSERPYRAALSHRKVMDILAQDVGTRIDPLIFTSFLAVVEASPYRYG